MLSTLVDIAPALIGGSAALIVAVMTPALTSLRRRRDAVNDLFDKALSALLLVQSARHLPTSAPDFIHASDPLSRAAFASKLAEEGFARFVSATENARTALAQIASFVPQAREWIAAGWELAEEREPEQRRIIEAARAGAVARERLFRARKY